jgi:hypothetical protein
VAAVCFERRKNVTNEDSRSSRYRCCLPPARKKNGEWVIALAAKTGDNAKIGANIQLSRLLLWLLLILAASKVLLLRKEL